MLLFYLRNADSFLGYNDGPLQAFTMIEAFLLVKAVCIVTPLLVLFANAFYTGWSKQMDLPGEFAMFSNSSRRDAGRYLEITR